jgi:Ankyrin repeats (many copies)
MSSSARAMVGTASPLEHAGVLMHVLNILGPGHHLFISAVNKAWRDSYEMIAAVKMAGVTTCYDDKPHLLTIASHTTLYSAVFTSASRVNLARECSLAFDNKKLQRIAGKSAEISTLRAARELGLQLTDEVLIGAAAAASVPKLQWLHTQQGCELPEGICDWAAKSGSTDILRWLKEHGSEFTADTCKGAAAGAHTHVLQFLRDEGCEWDETACYIAARFGHLPTLKWLHEQGCPWEPDEICSDAAECGSMEMLLYLRQQGCDFNEETMANAAEQGHLAVCQFLVAEQCPSDLWACANAAAAGHLETVRFLHDSGCPWDVDGMCARAAESGSLELLQYVNQQGCPFNAHALTAAAAKGHTHLCQFLRGLGTRGRAGMQHAMAMWKHCAGCMSRAAHGMCKQYVWQQ